jgi:hypothetical protein
MGKKLNNYKSGAAARHKERKQEEARERQARYDKMTPLQKMEQIHNRRGESKKEANKLLSHIA